MTAPTDQGPKSVRIVAYAAAQVGILKSVNIITSLTGYASNAIRTCVQLTAAQVAAGIPNDYPTYMDDSANPARLPTIYISGYTAPN